MCANGKLYYDVPSSINYKKIVIEECICEKNKGHSALCSPECSFFPKIENIIMHSTFCRLFGSTVDTKKRERCIECINYTAYQKCLRNVREKKKLLTTEENRMKINKEQLKKKNTVMMSMHYKENVHLVKQIIKMSEILSVMVKDDEIVENRPHLFNLLIEGPITEMKDMIEELEKKSATMLSTEE